MKGLSFDYNFSASKNLSGGINAEDMTRLSAKARKGYESLLTLARSGEVGFPFLPEADISSLKKFASVSRGRYSDVIVAGIGGSALGVEAIFNALLPFGHNALSEDKRGGYPRLWVADNADPWKINSIASACDPARTLLIVTSKSGGTVETAANFSILYDWLRDKGPGSGDVAVVTDPANGPLRAFASVNDIPAFDIPPSVGGRFSVLSPVGLLPALLLGADADALLKGAAAVSSGGADTFVAASAVYMYFMEKGKNINVLMPYSSRLEKFAEWFCQLWGESLGKNLPEGENSGAFGTTPVRTVGAIDQHSQVQLFRQGPKDKTVTFIEAESHAFEKNISGSFYRDFSYLTGVRLGSLLNAELRATEAALLTSGVPSAKLIVEKIDEFSLGALFMFFQYVVPIIGLAAGINPFDQPGVEEAKQYAYGLMNREGFESKKELFDKIYVKDEEFFV